MAGGLKVHVGRVLVCPLVHRRGERDRRDHEQNDEQSDPPPLLLEWDVSVDVRSGIGGVHESSEETVIINLRDANSSALVREASHERSRHVVMPLRL